MIRETSPWAPTCSVMRVVDAAKALGSILTRELMRDFIFALQRSRGADLGVSGQPMEGLELWHKKPPAPGVYSMVDT